MSSMRPRSPAHARPATTRGKNLCLGERREGEDEEGERSSSWLESVGVAEGEEDDEDEGDVEEGLEEDEAGRGASIAVPGWKIQQKLKKVRPRKE